MKLKKDSCSFELNKETNSDKVKDNTHEYSIVTHFINFKKNNTCVICLKSINNKNKITTRCNHNFHYNCINSWCNINDNCPLCRCSYPIG